MAEIDIELGGPMRVRGVPLHRLLHDGQAWGMATIDTPEHYDVCRCGGSSTMPLCDRVVAGIACFVELPPDGPAPGPFGWDVPDPAGPPAVALKPDGPVRVAGDVTITYAGEPIDPRDRVSLCRCGFSRCQPLCDSSHKPAGYRG